MQSIIILLILFTSHSFSANAIVNDEKSTLLSIKLMFNDTLNSLHDWTPPKHHCSWTGVQCNSAGSIDALDLSHMNLTGKISTSIATSLSNLKMLSTLDLSVNSFEGSFPLGLRECIALKIFNASGNNFSGKLPDDIGELTSLEILDLRGSFFEGLIPKSYRNLKSLTFLGLSGNNLSGKIPEEIGQLASLEKLIIGYNNFEGSIPKEIGKLSNLQYLDIAVAKLEGEIPSELGNLQFLNTVYLYKNNLEGQIPKDIGNISTLILLDLSDNKISGSIPSELEKLSDLRLLNLMCNKLTGQVPDGIGELTNLQVLELWNNSLTGPLPASLGRNSSLQWLDVSSNSLSGQLPVDLCNGKNLTKLILFNNQFSGLIPIKLSSCFSLVRVRIHNNKLNGTIPSGLGKLPKLQRLELARNQLAGEIPTDLAFSTSLSFIDLSYNDLNQSIPSNILSIPTLQSFVVSNNELTGKIPDQFQDSPSLSALDLSNNKLYATIPESLASCEKLVYLNLSSNKLGGEITTTLATMSALAVLDLSDNLLTGSIPEMFGSSPALEMMSLSNNNLSGPVPTNGILRTINPRQLSGNPSLCGGVLPPCVSNSNSQMPTRRKNNHIKHIAAGWAMGITLVLAIGIVLFASHQLYKRWYIEKFTEGNGPWPWRLIAFQRLNFSSSDILSSIKESNVIGTGANGVVYKADLQRSPHSSLAVKKLWNGVSDIEGEVSLLGKLRHRNIVRLLGYMHNDTDTMFLYEYMPHGSLWEALHGPAASRVLADWVSRYNVATGVAQGLAYLHHDCHPSVIHRDIKSNNILLDGNLEARIADFGLARMMLRKSETASIIAGSYGYIAPEYGYTLKIDQKSDIYSFGVVLMELLTGRRPIELEYGECQDIVGWVRENTRHNKVLERVLDLSIGGKCKHVQEEMLLVLRISLLCTAKLPKDRPSMRDVVSMLGEAKPRRKSNSNVLEKDKPVFRTLPDNEIV